MIPKRKSKWWRTKKARQAMLDTYVEHREYLGVRSAIIATADDFSLEFERVAFYLGFNPQQYPGVYNV
jgi:hypothetical protein